MAEIRFLPVCSNCNGIITEEVNVEDEVSLLTHTFVWTKLFYKICENQNIRPRRCQHCGAYFDSITMPIKLPFKVKDEG